MLSKGAGMYEIVMVEDNDREAETLTRYLERYGVENGVTFSIVRHRRAEPITLSKSSPDLIFLDIELPGIDGMEAATLLRTYDTTTPIVFITTFASYAISGYEVGAIDFMVKPVSYRTFSTHMGRVVRAIKRGSGKITVAQRGGLHVMSEDELTHVEVERHDLIYHTIPGIEAPAPVRGSLSELEQRLAGGPFCRISSHCLVNMAHVRKVAGDALTLSDGTILYISRARKKAVLAELARYFGGSPS